MLRAIAAWVRRGADKTPSLRRPELSDKPPTVSLLSMLQGSRRLLLLSAIGGLIGGGGVAGLITLITKSLDQDPDRAARLALPYVGLCIVVLAAGMFSELLVVRLAQSNLLVLRLWLTRHILSAPFQQLQTVGPHRLMATLTDDIGSIAQLIETLPPLLIEASTLFGALLYMGWLSPSLFVVFLAFLLGGGLGVSLLQNRSFRWHQRARQRIDALFGHFRTVTEGCKELKMNARRRRAFMSDLSATANTIRRQLCNGRTFTVISDYWGKLAFFLLIGLIVFALPRLEDISRETVTSFTFIVLFAMRPISVLLNTLPGIGRGVVAWRNIKSLGVAVAKEPHLEEGDESPPVAERPSVLELLQVRRQHRAEGGDSGFLFGPVNLRIDPGELIFVTGGNGSGKTTLALLLLGLYPPDDGEVRLDGEIVTDFNRDRHRQHFAAVFADAYIFDAFPGGSDAGFSKRADDLLERLQLANKVRIKDGHFSTVELSKGQRKRLALLAAYLEDRPFYLFDEWAAEQDPTFRDIFYKELLPQLKARGKTIIVITHDDRYFHLADRLLRLNMGQIEES
ncbi:cyclic peptide export ABC transporter [Methylocapsa polymorpha]|uniref:Cyclic peptide export ABC transporter n=1 Tax=Methylocapsa polymorpha TaxID=3080828 RepID=A0ABZ0HNC9_9HYPH|nr:cyclic peptide export ABC transporter [Methylocapsa sp. RX1]